MVRGLPTQPSRCTITLEVVVLQDNHTDYAEDVINRDDFLHLFHSFLNLILSYRLCRSSILSRELIALSTLLSPPSITMMGFNNA